MKQSFFTKSSLIVLLLSFVPQVNAIHEGRYYDNDECCNSWDILVKGGVAPIVWHGRGCFTSVSATLSPVGAPVATFNDFVRVPKFRDLFKTPWTVGVELGHRLSDCVRPYLDFQYRQASARDFDLNFPLLIGSARGLLRFNKYKSFSGYVGIDLITDWGCPCDALSWFIGIKVGFTRFHRSDLRTNLTLANIPGVIVTSETLDNCFRSNTVLSGGGRIGFDWGWNECWSLIIAAEFLGQCGRRLGDVLISSVNVPSIRFGHVASEIVFPVTIGVRFIF